MDEPGPKDPQEPGTGLPAAPAPAKAADAPPAPVHRLRGALVSRAAGWVVAVALAGAVVALSAVLATTPRELQVQALDGPAAITALPVRGAVTGPVQVRIGAVPPGLTPAAMCLIHARPGSVRVVLPARRGRPGQVITVRPPAVTVKPGQVKAGPGAVTLVPAVACPLR